MQSSKLNLIFIFGLLFLLISSSIVYSQDKLNIKKHIKKSSSKKLTKKELEKLALKLEALMPTKKYIGSSTGKFDLKKLGQQNRPVRKRRAIAKEVKREVECPSCKTLIPVLLIKSARIALDTDFCEHFVGYSEYSFEIWSCSICGYSHHSKFFLDDIPDALRTLVKKTLKPQMHAEIKSHFGNMFKKVKTVALTQKIIPTYVKVLNMTNYLDNQVDISNRWKVFIYMRGIYALRNEISRAPSATKLNPVLLKISNKLTQEINIPQKESAQPYYPTYFLSYYKGLLPTLKAKNKGVIALNILMAQSFNRLGYNAIAKAHLSKAYEATQRHKDFNSVLKYIKRLELLIDLETRLMTTTRDLMLSNFESSDEISTDAPFITYLIGEFSRRIGDYKNAYHWFSASKQLFPKEHPAMTWVNSFFKRKSFKTYTESESIVRHPPLVRKTVRRIMKQQAMQKKTKPKTE